MFLPLFIFFNLLHSCIHVSASTTTVTNCATRIGASSVSPVKTVTSSITQIKLPVVILSISTPTSTSTPHPTTTTITTTVPSITTTTKSTVTDKFLTTVTSTLSTTSLVTTTSTFNTVITTTTTSTTTSFISTSPGFLPIADTTGSAPPPPKKRAVSYPRGFGSNSLFRFNKRSLFIGLKGSYPIAVSCIATVQIQNTLTIVLTVLPTTTVLPRHTVSVTITRTTTVTVTFMPHASTTFTSSTTITSSYTSTITQIATSTSTNTVTAATTVTSYAACGPSNLLGPTLANGNYIQSVYNNGPGQSSFSTVQSTDTAYDCCVACITSSICTGSSFVGLCVLFQNQAGTCGAQSASSGYYDSEPGLVRSVTLSNGNCGYLYDGGIGE